MTGRIGSVPPRGFIIMLCGDRCIDSAMKIHLKNGKPASEGAILAIEVVLGCPLSESFRRFLAVHNGAEPECNSFKISNEQSSGIRWFVPAAEILRKRRFVDGLPQKAYPVAEDDCGNFVYIDEGRNGAVFFWDHELLDDPVELAPNFGAFLDLLEPFDTSTIQLKPGQVKKAWVDPEFLKKLKK
jgi:hypothetical protein